MLKDWAAILGRVLSEEGAFKSLYDHHPDLIIVLDRQGRYVDSNRAFSSVAPCVPAYRPAVTETVLTPGKHILQRPWKG